ncbi:MAG: alcohol dehydrogenase catalytic domain-containing protein, partial [Opitutia bacterium]
MKAVVLERPQEFRFFDAPEPPAPGPGEAVVRVHRVGICGTDYGGYLGKMPFYSYPRVPGHELGVEVLAVGAGVTDVKPGDRCSVEPYINCQQCYSCRRGFTNCCEKHQTLGVMCDGGMAERFLLPARKLHVSTKLTYDQLEYDKQVFEMARVVASERPQFANRILALNRALLSEILAAGNASSEFFIEDVIFTAEMLQSATMKFRYPQLHSKLPYE